MSEPLLRVEALRTCFFTRGGVAKAVDGVSFHVDRGEMLALVGESGCGKSVTALSILRLIADPPGRVVSGRILFEGRDLMRMTKEEMRALRGNEAAMIFQDPMTSLNPVFTIGDQIVEAILAHRRVTRQDGQRRALDLLELVGIPDAGRRIQEYPHRLSGGMRQRAVIAMALACEPKLLIADEPTTALDVTIQAQVLDLIGELKDKLGMGVLMITHDLGVVAQRARRVAVMYAGRIVEQADVADLFREPLHPYTQGLLSSIPKPQADKTPGRLAEIPGMVPALTEMPAGCAFAPRCPAVVARCRVEPPELATIGATRKVACFVAEERWKNREPAAVRL
jgi:peptide/nickel transport system ATP-binding protein